MAIECFDRQVLTLIGLFRSEPKGVFPFIIPQYPPDANDQKSAECENQANYSYPINYLQMQPQINSTYRFDIDGLRALAVLAVLLYHCGLGFPGGFVGVDVFFVISGYLITSLVIRDFEKGTFSIIDFWERRIRRIFPALAVTLGITLVIGFYLLLPTDFNDLGKSSIAQAFAISNVYFWRTSGYFEGPAEEKPLLHTWSLAVEEQFYIFLPILILLIFKIFKNKGRQMCLAAFVVVFLLSLVVSVYGVKKAPSATFYLLPTRAWELLVGSILCLLPRPKAKMFLIQESIGIVGLGAILFSYFAYNSQMPFPGLAALMPCFGAAALIWSNQNYEGQYSKVGKAFSTPILVGIGAISYSLYLVHWPLIVFIEYTDPRQASVSTRLMVVGLSLILAYLSWKFVETPFRKKAIFSKRNKILSFGMACSAGALIAGWLISNGGIKNKKFEGAVETALTAKKDKIEYKDQSLLDLRRSEFKAMGDSDGDTTWFVWGDSHGRALFSSLDKCFKDKGLKAEAAIHSATAPVVDEYFNIKGGLGKKAPEYAEVVLSHISDKKIKNVILVARWGIYQKENQVRLERALVRTIDRLESNGCMVTILLDVPTFETSVPEGVAKKIAFNSDLDWVTTKFDHRSTNSLMYRMMNNKRSVRWIDLSVALEEVGENSKFRVVDNGVPLYYDDNHLTLRGAEYVMSKTAARIFSDR